MMCARFCDSKNVPMERQRWHLLRENSVAYALLVQRNHGGTCLMVKKHSGASGSGTSLLDEKTQWRMHYRWRDSGGTCLEKTQWHMHYWCRDGSGTSLLVEKPQWRMLAGAETAGAHAHLR